jgi:hypothetical protein
MNTEARPEYQHQCPACGRDGKLYITQDNPPRAIIGCADCDTAEDEDGKWTLYAGGITVKP